MSHAASDDTRNRILQTAGRIFSEKGFQAATVRDICQAADVNIASINYYFGDKERLYIESVKRAHTMRTEHVAFPEWPPGTPPQTKLREFIVTMVTRMIGVKEAPWQTELLMREMLHPTTAVSELIQESIRPSFELLLEILDEVLPQDTPQARRHQIALSIVGQCLYYHMAREVIPLLIEQRELDEHFTPRQLAEHIAQFSLAALGLATPLGEEAGPIVRQSETADSVRR